MSELLKCPFCGGKDITYFFDITSGFVCEDCGVALDGFKTYEEAIKAWNTRKPMDMILERLEEEIKKCNRNYREYMRNFYAEGMSDARSTKYGINKAIEIIREEGGLWQK